VEILLMNGAFPVDGRTTKSIFEVPASKLELIAFVDAFSYFASLDQNFMVHTLVPAPETVSFQNIA